ncbi:ABC transporter substrate-binding protein [Vogesella sp. LIG4]|uniref:substrate-binding periplasmic protein n=1 Tax=Vogesella sp. LIG4 TaxID=1192162 RepID=UPI00081FC8EC|nr:transporter substrate-binding domain-containing protein [Vogesella sp. LIG4]SCK19423.1 polar amino acid transport system substrate-binding protein [Vogesella sp. LIG4]
MVGGGGAELLTHSTDGQVAYRNGQLHGLPHGGKRAFFVELLLQLQQELQLHVAVRDVPLARGWQMLQVQPQVALFNLSRTLAREPLARWVGPIWQEADYFYERSAYPTGVTRLEEARLLPVCVLNGNVHDHLLAQLGFSQLSRSNSYEGCLQMLVAGRVELVVSSSLDIDRKLRNADINPREVSQLPVVVNSDDGYIALSAATPEQEVRRWQAALDKLRRNGVYQQLYQQFAE